LSSYIHEPARKTPIHKEVDVLVAGGGLSGVMAAVSAARSGAKTMLVERYSFLGAVATMGLPIQGYCASDGSQAVMGLADEFRRRLRAAGGATDFIPCAMHNAYLVVDPESVKLICQRMIQEAGVDLLLSAPVVDLAMRENRIAAAVVEGKSGREAIVANQYIDCTGDADLVARSGGAFQMAKVHALQATTMNVQMAGVDIRAIQKLIRGDPSGNTLFPLLSREQVSTNERYIMVGLTEYLRRAASDNIDGLSWGNVCYITLVNEGTVCLNSVHISGLNPCDTGELTSIETQGREEAWKVAAFMKKYIPGFENAYIIATGPWAGIRESRNIKGIRTLTEADVRTGNIPEDTIGLGCYPIDFHIKGSANGSEISASEEKNGLKFEKVPLYGIPYGSLVPENSQNLLVAGRTISATRTAISSARVMAPCMAEGEAAGIAAAICASESSMPSALDADRVRSALLLRGARLC